MVDDKITGGSGGKERAGATGAAADEPRPTSIASKATDRAFVIQIAPECDVDSACLAGRVQHLATQDGGNFGSVDGLLAIVRRVLDRAAGRERD